MNNELEKNQTNQTTEQGVTVEQGVMTEQVQPIPTGQPIAPNMMQGYQPMNEQFVQPNMQQGQFAQQVPSVNSNQPYSHQPEWSQMNQGQGMYQGQPQMQPQMQPQGNYGVPNAYQQKPFMQEQVANPTMTNALSQTNTTDLQVQQKSSIAMQKEQLKLEPQVQQISRQIDIKNQVQMLELGRETANGISQFSDKVLSVMKSSKVEETSQLLKSLNKVMDKFDPKDFKEEEKKGFLNKLFNRGKESIERFLAKYETMDNEVSAIQNEIMKFEQEMKQNTMTLEEMYNQNINYFQSLGMYVAAIELKIDELKQTLPHYEQQAAQGNQQAGMEYETLKNSIQLLEQRRYDLEMAQQVSFQSAPQIRMMQQGNNQLIAKMNSAFVTTIPIFKQGLIHAVMVKRQGIVAESMSELDKRTNEMLIKNAENISNNSVRIAEMAGQSSIKVETMEQTWQTIMRGIEETKQIQEQTAKDREEGRKRIEALQLEYEKLNRK